MGCPPKCPYFGITRNNEIRCLPNGPDAKHAAKLNMSFPSKESRVLYWKTYCCDNWKQCTLSGAMEEEYNRNHDEV